MRIVLRTGTLCTAGQLQMHFQTTELRSWLERPTYGAPNIVGELPVVRSKCSILEPTAPGAPAPGTLPAAAAAAAVSSFLQERSPAEPDTSVRRRQQPVCATSSACPASWR